MKHSLLVLLCASCLLTHNIHAGDEDPLFPVKEGGKWGFINRAGEMVIKPQYAYCDDQFSEGLAPVRVDGSRSGYIDRNNKMVIPQQLWSSAESFRDGLAAVGGGTPFRFGYIDKTGKYVIEPRDGLSYGGFHDGLMKIKEGEKWGYIDKTGRVVIPPVFVDATDFSCGLAGVVHESLGSGYINAKGDWVIRLDSAVPHYEGFSEDLAPVWDKKSGLFGYITTNGTFAIAPRYKGSWGFP